MSRNELTPPLLEIKHLRVEFLLDEGTVTAITDVNFQVPHRGIVGIIGESGCGKSITAQAILRIIPKPGRITMGQILFRPDPETEEAVDLASLDPNGARIRQVRGAQISMIFQEPMTAFSPVHTIGNQIIEAIRLHRNVSTNEATQIAVAMLEKVGIPQARTRLSAYSFQLSGGMRQRAMIAMALCTKPQILIADEPTTALDVTIQAQILELIKKLRDDLKMAILLITHDLGVVAETCESVNVMYLGRIIESGPVDLVLTQPKHPYTQALLSSIPRLTGPITQRLTVIDGSLPGPFVHLPGCTFAPRCRYRIDGICSEGLPPPVFLVGRNHQAACHLHAQLPKVNEE